MPCDVVTLLLHDAAVCRIHLSIPGAGETPEDWGRNFHFQVIEKA